jgi:hypothetical protein
MSWPGARPYFPTYLNSYPAHRGAPSGTTASAANEGMDGYGSTKPRLIA